MSKSKKTKSKEEKVEEIQSTANILKIIGKRVKLTKFTGFNDYKGICPFHDDTSSSFHVSEAEQIFRCLGCGVSGDINAFIMKYEDLDMNDSIRFIANEIDDKL